MGMGDSRPHRGRGAKGRKVSEAPQEDVLDYLADMASEMMSLAHRAGCARLMLLFERAYLEARQSQCNGEGTPDKRRSHLASDEG